MLYIFISFSRTHIPNCSWKFIGPTPHPKLYPPSCPTTTPWSEAAFFVRPPVRGRRSWNKGEGQHFTCFLRWIRCKPIFVCIQNFWPRTHNSYLMTCFCLIINGTRDDMLAFHISFSLFPWWSLCLFSYWKVAHLQTATFIWAKCLHFCCVQCGNVSNEHQLNRQDICICLVQITQSKPGHFQWPPPRSSHQLSIYDPQTAFAIGYPFPCTFMQYFDV